MAGEKRSGQEKKTVRGGVGREPTFVDVLFMKETESQVPVV